MLHRSRLSVCAVMAALGLCATGQAQQPARPTFRAETAYIEVIASVVDTAGRFVGDLRADDFVVLEDGRPQTITAFSRVAIPARAAAAAILPAAVETAPHTNQGLAEGRTVVILVDTLHVAPGRTAVTRALLRQFVTEHLGPQDRAALVQAGGLGRNQDFTTDKRRLLAAIDTVVGERIKSRVLSKWERLAFSDVDISDPHAPERAARAHQSLDALRRTIGHMAGVRGRQAAVLLISEGFDLDLNDRVGQSENKKMRGMYAQSVGSYLSNKPLEAVFAAAVGDDLRAVVEAATRVNVALYTVDPRGLASETDDAMIIPGRPAGFYGMPTQEFRRELFDSQQMLRSMAESTGGRAIVGTNNFRDGFTALVDDTGAYYVLGYQTSRDADGKFHEIAVRTSRPGITVRARKGYFASRESKRAAGPNAGLDTLLSSPVAMPGLSLRVASAVVPDGGGSAARIALEIDGADLSFVERDGRFATEIEIAYLVVRDDGDIVARGDRRIELALSAASVAAVRGKGLRYLADRILPPGRYQLRLAVRAAASAGSVFWDVEIAEPVRRGGMSELMIASGNADRTPTISDTASARPPGGLMTAARTFDRDDTLSIVSLARVDAMPAQSAAIVVRNADGSHVMRSADVQTLFDEGGATVRYVGRLPLESLEPGLYLVSLEAAHGGGVDSAPAVAIEVR